MRRYSAHIKLIIYFILLVIIPVFIVGTISIIISINTVEILVNRQMDNAAKQTVEKIKLYLNDATNTCNEFQNLFQKDFIPKDNKEKILKAFVVFKKIHPQLNAIYYGDKSGKFFKDPPKIRPGYDPRVRPWYKKAIKFGKTIWTDVYIFATSNKPGITVAAPIADKDGEYIGVIGIDIILDELSEFLKQLKIGENGRVFIIETSGEAQGKILAHPISAYILKPIKEKEKIFTEYLETEGKEHTSKYFIKSSSFDDGFRKWIIGIIVPKRDFQKDIDTVLYSTLLSTFIGLIIAGFLGVFASDSIIKPIKDSSRDGLIKQQMYNVGILTTTRIKYFINNAETVCKELAELFIKRVISLDNPNKIISTFQSIKNTYPQFSSIYFVSIDNKFFIEPPQWPDVAAKYNPLEKPWYKKAVSERKLIWTDVYILHSLQKPGLTVAMPIEGENNTYIGVIGLDITLEDLSKFVRELKIGKKGRVFIVETKGNLKNKIIAHPISAYTTKDVIEKEKTFKQVFDDQITFVGEYICQYIPFKDNYRKWLIGIVVPKIEFLKVVEKFLE